MRDCLIIGGAGFIGSNLADHYLSDNRRVTIFDNFSRAGAEHNVRWLKVRHGDRLNVIRGDIRHPGESLSNAVNHSEVVFHLAGQVAVTTSVTNPREDFEVNALGTFNVLEAARLSSSQPVVIYSSTNKVYGKMANLPTIESNGRYEYADQPAGISESQPLDFYSPYGCSKGAGDQYVLDYARIYGLRTVVFRQSCIYGPRQFGIEDQGWVAWFCIQALRNLQVTIYGNGKQVRDVLHISDLIQAYDAALERIDYTAGQAYNIGGGPRNTLSLLELVRFLEHMFRRPLRYTFDEWRPGDQLVFISNIDKARQDLGWIPAVDPEQGVAKLVEWLIDNQELFCETPLAHTAMRMGG
jgi:CDP-paratose 2-epimerase